jgi:formate hydrogenlyase subunit 4
MFKFAAVVHIVLALGLAPLLVGIINRTKAVFAGRRGQPILQLYFDLFKLLGKGAVYSRTTTWVFLTAPIVGLAAVSAALSIAPLGGVPGLLAFPGDLLLFAYLLGLMRFCTVISALDTGSAFEGMGASREVFFSALAEPALILSLAVLAIRSQCLSLSGMYAAVTLQAVLTHAAPTLLLVAASLLVVFLTENARIPIDDPNTHLELTMIHEVMVLDHSGPDFAMIQYAAALKLWVLGSLLVGLLVPVRSGWWAADLLCGLAGLAVLAVVVGVIESTMARLRLVRVPQFLVAASVLSILALVLVLR